MLKGKNNINPSNINGFSNSTLKRYFKGVSWTNPIWENLKTIDCIKCTNDTETIKECSKCHEKINIVHWHISPKLIHYKCLRCQESW